MYNKCLRGLTSTFIPELVKPYAFCHFSSHKAWVHDADNDALVLKIQAKQLANHVESCLAGVMSVVATPFLWMSQSDTARLGRYKHHFGTLAQETFVDELVDDKDGGNGAGRIHPLLFLPFWTFVPGKVFCSKVTGCDNLSLFLSIVKR